MTFATVFRLFILTFLTSSATFADVKSTQAEEENNKKAVKSCKDHRQFTFSWSFKDGCNLKPRGGSSKGAPVKLDPKPHPGWLSLQEKGLSKVEKDRRAILAMAGPYRTSFDFLETVLYKQNAKPDRPYQTWGTEYVYVLESRKDFISLQHIMVMFFENDKGAVEGPMVMKHWRQDWRYEDTEMLTYQGADTWKKQSLSKTEAKGSWTQAVFQVDDSPRYEAYGRWRHEGSFSTWISSETWRPLPRREFSIRDDYQVLIGTNRHTITAAGWVQEEENLKTLLDANGLKSSPNPYIAKEIGVNRYERIIDHDFTGGDKYWKQTGAFWNAVRNSWKEVFATSDTLKLLKKVDGESLFMPLFAYAQEISESGTYKPEEGKAYAQSTIAKYIADREYAVTTKSVEKY